MFIVVKIFGLKDRFHRLEEKLRQIEWKNQWKPAHARGCEHTAQTNTQSTNYVIKKLSDFLFDYKGLSCLFPVKTKTDLH